MLAEPGAANEMRAFYRPGDERDFPRSCRGAPVSGRSHPSASARREASRARFHWPTLRMRRSFACVGRARRKATSASRRVRLARILAGHDLKGYFRATSPEFQHLWGDDECRDVVSRCNPHSAGGSQVAPQHLPLDGEHGMLDVFSLTPDGFTIFSKRVTGLPTIEQAHPKPPLQGRNAPGDGGRARSRNPRPELRSDFRTGRRQENTSRSSHCIVFQKQKSDFQLLMYTL